MILFLLLSVAVSSAGTFNLEPRISILKTGRTGSYFGFSVTSHQILLSDYSGRDRIESVILVGAPLGGNEREGTVWKCPFTSQSEDCVRIESESYDDRDNNRGQWLGVVVDSQGPGKQVIVCAHRYVKREYDHRWGNGRCFTLSQNLEHLATWDPCEGREKNSAHEAWGFCQAGTSALLTDDNMALIGTPGPFTWRGTVFAMSVEDDFLFRDKTHYHIPVKDGDSPVGKYSYLGMSLASGNFLPQSRSCGQRLSYASGAPRDGGSGRVLIFVKCKDKLMHVQRILSGESFASSFGYSLATVDLNGDGLQELVVGAPFFRDHGAVYVYKNSVNRGLDFDAQRTRILPERKSVESRFGFSVANAGDLNSDGKQDLVVGAPYDGRGTVYVYNGGGRNDDVDDNHDNPILKLSQIIRAQDLPFPSIRTFGYSLNGGIDLDSNNHSDIVVGAFESDSAIIIRSRPVIDIVTWFGRRPRVIDPTLHGCETDLMSSEVCFGIESCFLIKNFPSNIETTHIQYTLQAEIFPGGRKVSRIRFGGGGDDDDDDDDNDDEDNMNNNHIIDDVNNHHSLYRNGNNGSHTPSSSMFKHQSQKIVPVERDSLTGCFYETAYLRDGTLDIRTPIKFRLTLKLQQDEPRLFYSDTTNNDAPPNINQFPILNVQEAQKTLEIPFQKSCGDDDLCHSNLQAHISVLQNNNNNNNENVLEVVDQREVVLQVRVTNSGESAYAAVLEIGIDSSFNYIGQGSSDIADINCDYYYRNRKIVCKLGNPYSANRTDLIKFRVLPRQIIGSRIVTFNATTNTTSEDVAPTRRHELRLRIAKRAEVSIRSSVQPAEIWYDDDNNNNEDTAASADEITSLSSLSEIGSKVTHTFQVFNDGPWHVDELDVVIDWPYRLTEDAKKWLLYLSEAPEIVPSGDGQCFLSSRVIDPMGLGPFHHRRRRVKRQFHLPPTILDCSNVLCHLFTCRLYNLRANESVVITVRSRVWNATLADEYSGKSVAIRTRARVVVPEDLDQSFMDDETIAEVMGFPRRSRADITDSVPIWIVLVSVLIGLTVVCIISALLWKLGFFRRSRYGAVSRSDGNGDDGDVMISAKKSVPSEYIS